GRPSAGAGVAVPRAPRRVLSGRIRRETRSGRGVRPDALVRVEHGGAALSGDRRLRDLNRWGIAVAALAILLVSVAARSERAAPRGSSGKSSTFLSDGSGALALYLVCEELPLKVSRWMRPLDELFARERSSTLVLLGSSEAFESSEATRLLDAVKAGARLVYAPTRLGGDALLAELGLTIEPTPGGEAFCGPVYGEHGEAFGTPLSETARRL